MIILVFFLIFLKVLLDLFVNVFIVMRIIVYCKYLMIIDIGRVIFDLYNGIRFLILVYFYDRVVGMIFIKNI